MQNVWMSTSSGRLAKQPLDGEVGMAVRVAGTVILPGEGAGEEVRG